MFSPLSPFAAAVAACLLLIANHAQAQSPQAPSSTAPPLASVLSLDTHGYLLPAQLPDSLRWTPPPPVAGSSADAHDLAIAHALQPLQGSVRWQQARQDAQLHFPQAASHFACALGVSISAEHTPHLYRLLRLSMLDASGSTGAAKQRYQRPRPFMVNGGATCTPEDEPDLRGNGSYPSGHSAIGWSWAQLLAELAPQRADALIARGRSYAESRMVCNVHWQSDVLQSRVAATATVAALHADAGFRRDLRAARAELDQARRRGERPDPQRCEEEAAALATPLPGVL